MGKPHIMATICTKGNNFDFLFPTQEGKPFPKSEGAPFKGKEFAPSGEQILSFKGSPI